MQIIHWDEELFLYLNNLGSTTWDPFWKIVTNKLSWIPLYAIIAYFIFKKWGLKMLFITLALIGIMIFCTDQISHYYKDDLIQRFRPCRDAYITMFMRHIEGVCGGKFGFFSGHATNHFAIAILVGKIFRTHKWFLPTLIVWASFIAYSRVYLGVHFPLDVLSGALIGSLFGYLFYQFWLMAKIKFN